MRSRHQNYNKRRAEQRAQRKKQEGKLDKKIASIDLTIHPELGSNPASEVMHLTPEEPTQTIKMDMAKLEEETDP